MKRRCPWCALLALLLLLSGCTQPASVVPTPTPTPSPSPAPLLETGLDFVLPCYPYSGFHPITGENKTNLTLVPLLYQGLFFLDSHFAPQKQLCQDYTVSEDGLTWFFTLVPAQFSDGTPLAPSDVAQSLNAARTSPRFAPRLAQVTAVTATAEGVTLVLSRPNSALPATLDVPIFREVPDAIAPCGTGAYALEGTDRALRLVRRPTAPEDARAPQAIALYPIQAADDLIYAFDTGAISLVCADMIGTNSLGFSGSFEVWEFPTSTLLYLGFNSKQGLCRDPYLRRALQFGFDRAAVATALLARHGESAALPVSPASPLYDLDLAETLDYAPATLERLLTENGWQKSEGTYRKGRAALALTLLVNTDNSYKLSVAEYLAEGLTQAGVSVTLRKLPWEEYLKALEQGEFDLYLGEVRLTADFDLSPLVLPGGALNYGDYDDPETAALLSSFLAAPEAEKAGAATALYTHLGQTVPFVPLCFKSGSVLTRWGQVAQLTPTQNNVFYGFSEKK